VAIRVKDLSQSANKWAANAGNAAAEFAQNAQAAAETWAANTAAAANNYHQAVSASAVKDRFRRGVQRAGAAKFSRKIAAVAQSRYSTGVSEGLDDWRTGFEPYASTLAGLTLPARRPRGDVANLQRVAAVASALNARRLALLGSGSGA